MSAQDVTPTGPPQGSQSTGGRRGGVISRGGVDPNPELDMPRGSGGSAPARRGGQAPGQPPRPQSVFEEPGSGLKRPAGARRPRFNLEDPDLWLHVLRAEYPHPDIDRLLARRNRG